MTLIQWALLLVILIVVAALIMRVLVSIEHRRLQRMKQEATLRRHAWEYSEREGDGGRAA